MLLSEYGIASLLEIPTGYCAKTSIFIPELKDYTEILLADAYGGYNGLVAGNAITRAGCWSHALRKFVEAEKTALEIAREAVDLIGRVFAVEKQAKDMSLAERLALRQTQSVAVLAELRAVNYALGQWELTVSTRDGAVPIDNNVSEREMKRVVLNRKKLLFVGNLRGGRTAAILASLTSSYRRHEMDPQVYFMSTADESSHVAGKRHRRLAPRSLETNSPCQVRGFGNTSARFLKTD